jgi:hypothetical protein
MNIDSILQNLIEQVQLVREEKKEYVVIFSEDERMNHMHEFLFFVKPEITLISDRTNQMALFKLALDKIDSFGLHVRDIRIISASYLENYNIIAKHYGVINALSRDAQNSLGLEAIAKFRELFGIDATRVRLLGSLEFLEQYPHVSIDKLDAIWQQASAFKLSGGTYCAKINLDGQEIYLVNGFHPRQLIHFISKGRSIVTFTLTGDLDWSVARNNFIGKTNPADAMAGSLRNEILLRQREFGLTNVSASQNGFHLSAGPLEGLIELIRYNSDYIIGDIRNEGDYAFGCQLKAQFNDNTISDFANNRTVIYEGKKASPFDLTEEKNSVDALEILSKTTPQKR